MSTCYTVQINLFVSEASDLLSRIVWKTWPFYPVKELHLSSKHAQVQYAALSPGWQNVDLLFDMKINDPEKEEQSPH